MAAVVDNVEDASGEVANKEAPGAQVCFYRQADLPIVLEVEFPSGILSYLIRDHQPALHERV